MTYIIFTLMVFSEGIMSAVNFNMRLEAELKEQVTPILEDYGLTMPQAFKLFLNQIVKTKAIPLSFDYAREPDLTPKAAAKLLQSLKRLKMAKVHRVRNGRRSD